MNVLNSIHFHFETSSIYFFLNFGEMIKIHEIIHKIYQFDEDSKSLFTTSDVLLSNPDWIP